MAPDTTRPLAVDFGTLVAASGGAPLKNGAFQKFSATVVAAGPL